MISIQKKTVYILLILLVSCTTHSSKNQEIKEIIFSTDYFSEDVKEIKIKDSVQLKRYLSKIKALNRKSRKIIKPFKGSILIKFVVNINGRDLVLNDLTTGLIIKDECNYLFTNSNGYFEDEELAEDIIKLFNNYPLVRSSKPTEFAE